MRRLLLVAAVLASPALADRTIIYATAQTRLGPTILVTRRLPGPVFDCEGTCISETAAGADTRNYRVSATGQATVAACFTALQTACIP